MITDMPESYFRETYNVPEHWSLDMGDSGRKPVRICRGTHAWNDSCAWEAFYEGMPGLLTKEKSK